jgi:hypothetical protein
MERKSWKESKCGQGQGSNCCKHLLSGEAGEAGLCTKPQSEAAVTFSGNAIDCPGMQSLARVEAAINLMYDIYDKIELVDCRPK